MASDPASPSDHPAASELAALYAPIVVNHPDETLLAMDPMDFIGDASLIWRRGDGHVVIAETGAIDPSALGRPTSDGSSSPYAFERSHPWDFTRPFDLSGPEPGKAFRGQVPEEEGYALSPRQLEPGRLSSIQMLARPPGEAPCFYEVETAQGGPWKGYTAICFWCFYGSNRRPRFILRNGLVAAAANGGKSVIEWLLEDPKPVFSWTRPEERPAQGRTLQTEDLLSSVLGMVNHQGDWEGITVLLPPDPAKGYGVVYRAHGDDPAPVWYPPLAEGERITALVAVGSHAFHSSEGADVWSEYGDETDEGGARWDTRNHLLDVRRESWYGFGGSWGDPDLGPHAQELLELVQRAIGQPLGRGEFTGPLGPSRWKSFWPKAGPAV